MTEDANPWIRTPPTSSPLSLPAPPDHALRPEFWRRDGSALELRSGNLGGAVENVKEHLSPELLDSAAPPQQTRLTPIDLVRG